VIVDFHTHIFPPEVIADRDGFLAADPTFRDLYESPRARLATADQLLASMDAAGVDVSVALGFAWADAATCRLHNDTLLEAGRKSSGRIVPFCTLPLAEPEAVEAEMLRCLADGAMGFGELRPDNHGFDLMGPEGRRLGEVANESGAMLLFHASEPAGHAYAGKQGLRIDTLYEFIAAHPDARIIAAHWGGGLPFYALMPEVRLALANVRFDTAATSLLYNPGIYDHVSQLIGAEHILFGSDYPLLSQKRSRERIEAAGLPDEAVAAILGANAARLLGLDDA
jgi:predicted TIM-barrel fold metal-dependent hydrolase